MNLEVELQFTQPHQKWFRFIRNRVRSGPSCHHDMVLYRKLDQFSG